MKRFQKSSAADIRMFRSRTSINLRVSIFLQFFGDSRRFHKLPCRIQAPLAEYNAVRAAFPVDPYRLGLFTTNREWSTRISGLTERSGGDDENRSTVRSPPRRSRLSNGGATCVCAPLLPRIWQKRDREETIEERENESRWQDIEGG